MQFRKIITAALVGAGAVGATGTAEAQEFTWTGLYLNAAGGYAFGTAAYTDYEDGTDAYDFGPEYWPIGGFLGGVEAGFRQQLGPLVLGFGASAYLGLIYGEDFDGRYIDSTTIDEAFFVGGQLGLAVGRVLPYGSVALALVPATFAVYDTVSMGSDVLDILLKGVAFGGGIQVALGDHYSFGFDYKRVMLQDAEMDLTVDGLAHLYEIRETGFHLFSFLIGFRF